CRNQVNTSLVRGGEPQPRAYRAIGTDLGPLRPHNFYLHVARLGLVHAGGALFGGKAFGWALNVQDRSALGQKCAKLMSLDAADFFVVGADAKNRDAMGLADLRDVVDIPVQHDPADAGADSGPCNLREGRPTHRFEDD